MNIDEPAEIRPQMESIPPQSDPTSPFSFIHYLECNPNTREFIYMIPVNDGKSGAVFNPYNLCIVDFSDINNKSPQGYYTMSSAVLF